MKVEPDALSYTDGLFRVQALHLYATQRLKYGRDMVQFVQKPVSWLQMCIPCNLCPYHIHVIGLLRLHRPSTHKLIQTNSGSMLNISKCLNVGIYISFHDSHFADTKNSHSVDKNRVILIDKIKTLKPTSPSLTFMSLDFHIPIFCNHTLNTSVSTICAWVRQIGMKTGSWQVVHPSHSSATAQTNLLKTKRNLLYIRNQFVPRSKHFPPRL